MRGSEALGGGLNAVFALEGGFSLDTGQLGQGGRLFGRQAWVGLGGGFGRAVLGRVASFSSGTGAFDMFGDTDPFYTGYHTAGLQNTFSSAGSLRLDNSVLWQSGKMGGFQGGVGYSFRANGAENAGGSGNNNNVLFAGVSFGTGPVYVAVTYDRIKLGEVGGDPVQKNLQVGGTFDLKVVKLHAAYAREDKVFPNVISATPQQAPGSDATAWMGGVSVPLGAGKLMASYQKRNVDSLGLIPEGDRKGWGVGYEHSLSRRTYLHAVYGSRTDEGSLKTATSGGQSQITLGMTHFF
jgi:predicted porin